MSDNEAKEPLRVTIDRSRWLRGEGSHSSSLLRGSDGKMCCLGFVALAAGHSKEEIKGRQAPESMMRAGIDVGFIDPLGPVCHNLMVVNDATLPARLTSDLIDMDDAPIGSKTVLLIMNEQEREEYLTKTMVRIGIELSFVDGLVTT